jgi:hypothetical protein
MKDKYIDECKFIQQNCTYTAEAHHQMALSAKGRAFWLEVIPSVASAVTGTLVAIGWASNELLLITIAGAVTTAVSSVLNPAKVYQQHLDAGKNFTALKHDARFLHESRSHKLSDEAFAECVESLHQRYNELIKTVPPTDGSSFKKAQEVVQSGTHDPDKNVDGTLK